MNEGEKIFRDLMFLNVTETLVLNSDFKELHRAGFTDIQSALIQDIVSKLDNVDRVYINPYINFLCKVVTIEKSKKTYIVVRKEMPFHMAEFEDPFVGQIFKHIELLQYDIVVLKDKEVVFRNEHLRNFLGLSQEEGSTDKANTLSPLGYQKIEKFLDSKKDGTLLLEVKDRNGKLVILRNHLTYYNYMGHDYYVSINKSIEDVEKVQDSFIEELDYLRHAVASISEGVIVLNNLNRIVLMNGSASDLVGLSYKDVFNEPIEEVIKFFNQDNSISVYLQESHYRNKDTLLYTQDGMFWNVDLTVDDFYNDKGTYLGKVVTIVDLSEIKKRENDILYLSYHDVLTGLYNRTFLEETIKRLDTRRQLPFSIIMGDVNGLKITNDVFGHEAGDNLLRNIARVLKQACRDEDIIGRWGGDEFVLLLPKTGNDEANMVTKRIIRAFEDLDDSYMVNGLLPSISLGYGIKAFETEDVFETLKEAEVNMYKRKMLTKDSMYSGILESMKAALYEKSHETEEHAERLYKTCLSISKYYELSNDENSDLELFCMLHDLGKIGVPDDILKYPGKLNDAQMGLMKTHSEIGYRIAQQTPNLAVVANYILSHHERWDGKGYPRGLKGRQIPLLARILAVADAYDAMTHDRVYRKAMTHEAAIEEIEKNSGTQFDSNIVKIFIEGFNTDIR
jgi:diguanylate cyclase (GGDEF)-like protein/PAS domain S-box-containing protein